MIPRLDGQVIVVGGGAGSVGRAVVDVLLFSGARVIVPVRNEAVAERFYLAVDAETVPRLRTAVGEFNDPAMPRRIAAVARREFGGLDHLVSAIGTPPIGWLNGLDADGVQHAVESNVSAPARFILGLLPHLNGGAPVKRVVAVTATPGLEQGGRPDAWSLGRSFLEGLIQLLREPGRPGMEFYALRVPRLRTAAATAAGAAPAGPLAGPEVAGYGVARLLAEGAGTAIVEAGALPR